MLKLKYQMLHLVLYTLYLLYLSGTIQDEDGKIFGIEPKEMGSMVCISMKSPRYKRMLKMQESFYNVGS